MFFAKLVGEPRSCSIYNINHLSGESTFSGNGSIPAQKHTITIHRRGQKLRRPDEEIPLDAINNWWDDRSGPSGKDPGNGNAVSENVDYDPP